MDNPVKTVSSEAMAALPAPVSRRTELLIVAALLLAALIGRLVYAANLPINSDEHYHLREAATVGWTGHGFHLPIGSKLTNHPALAVNLIALGQALTGGSVYGARVLFIVLNVFGLAGAYLLARRWFGTRAALIALFLAGVDRRWILDAAQLLTFASLFLVPWILLFMARCLDRGRWFDWAVLGLLIGIGFNLYEIIILLLPPFALWIVLGRQTLRVIKQPGLYLGAGIAVLLAVPYIIWSLSANAPGFNYAIMRADQFAVSPRFFLLYLGDLLIGLIPSTKLMLSWGCGAYVPRQLPCFWMAGILYLLALVYSLRYLRDSRYQLLLLAVVGVGVPVSLIAPDEWFSDFWYATYTLVPAIILLAATADRLLNHRAGRVVVVLIFAILAGNCIRFLSGPKWGYFSPDWEKAFLGEYDFVIAGASQMEPATDDQIRRVRQLIDERLDRHPDNTLLLCLRAMYPRDAFERGLAMERLALLAPKDPQVAMLMADQLKQSGQPAEAINWLKDSLESGNDDLFQLHQKLAELALSSRDLPTAITRARAAVARKRDDARSYLVLYLACDRSGQDAEAEAALQAFKAWSLMDAAGAYLDVAGRFIAVKDYPRAERFIQHALRVSPDHVGALLQAARVKQLLNQPDQAIPLLEHALRVEPGNGEARQMFETLRGRPSGLPGEVGTR